MSPKRCTVAAALLAVAPAIPAAGIAAAADTLASGRIAATVDNGDPGVTLLADLPLLGDVLDTQTGFHKSAAEAARQARREHGGKVLSVTPAGEGKSAHYRVKLLSDGNIRVVEVPAN